MSATSHLVLECEYLGVSTLPTSISSSSHSPVTPDMARLLAFVCFQLVLFGFSEALVPSDVCSPPCQQTLVDTLFGGCTMMETRLQNSMEENTKSLEEKMAESSKLLEEKMENNTKSLEARMSALQDDLQVLINTLSSEACAGNNPIQTTETPSSPIEKLSSEADATTNSIQTTESPSSPIDCGDIHGQGETNSGSYQIQPSGLTQPITVYCEIDNDGAWTYLMRRTDSTSFSRGWQEYKEGFGQAASTHWLGNENIWAITNQATYELRVEFTSLGTKYWATYSNFAIGPESTNYKLLSLGTYSGNSGHDTIRDNEGEMFSTTNRDHDSSSYHCAQITTLGNGAGWWYASCGYSYPTSSYGCSSGGCARFKVGSNNRFSITDISMKVVRL